VHLHTQYYDIRWGCDHEKVAFNAYKQQAITKHKNFQCSEAGLFVDADRPYLGASPDGLVNCSCCEDGHGVLEIKCPFCFKDALPDDNSADTNYYMENNNGEWKLKRQHAYYYQVQMQMAICKAAYCDFVVWSESGYVIERIEADNEFFDQQLESLYDFFVYGMLPEIIGKWYTRRPVADTANVVPRPVPTEAHDLNDEDEDITKLWCYCQEPSFGDMILCDNEECPIKWFHFDCLRIRCPPKNRWYCPSCRKLPQFTKGKGSKKKSDKDSAINIKF